VIIGVEVGVGMVQVLGTVAVIGSVLVLAFQARELARQTRHTNEVAATQAHRDLIALFRPINLTFVEHPELRAQFFGRLARKPTARELEQVESTAEVYADALQASLDTTERLTGYGWDTEPWTAYAEAIIRASPALRALLYDNPGFWPPLDRILVTVEPTPPTGPEDASP
jgi:hypothetical protein